MSTEERPAASPVAGALSHAPSGEPRRTALHAVHAALGASFTDFGGWQMPLRYSSDLAEHHAVRRSAGIFDLSHMGEVRVVGPQAAAALDHALTGAISSIALGRARYTMIVTEDGGIIDDLIVYHLGESDYLVVPNAGNRERVAAALAQRCAGFDCEVMDRSESIALLAVQGPRASQILGGVVESGAAIPAALRPDPQDDGAGAAADVLCGPHLLARLRYYAAVRATAAGHAIVLARTGYTGEDGFELFCGTEDAEDLWRVITEAAAGLPPTVTDDGELPALTACGLAARDSLRLEAGMPLYGHELFEEITPYDAGLGSVVALDKEEFVGREALAERSGREGAAGTLVLVALAGEGRRAARAGGTVLDGAGTPVGTVTSGLLSPTLGHPIALALLAPFAKAGTGTDAGAGAGTGTGTDAGAGAEAGPAWPIGTALEVDVRGRALPMGVVESPFYRRPR